MSKTYTVTEYDKEDIEELDFMSNEDIIESLEVIKRGYLPSNSVYGPKENETYSEDQYDATKLRIAVRKAIEIIEQQKGE